MSDDVLNPYEPPKSKTIDSSPRLSAWRWIPALFFSLVGGICLVPGVFGAAILLSSVFRIESRVNLVEMIAGSSLYLGLGLAWMTAGKSFRKGNYRKGAKEILAGIVVALTLFALLSVWNFMQ